MQLVLFIIYLLITSIYLNILVMQNINELMQQLLHVWQSKDQSNIDKCTWRV